MASGMIHSLYALMTQRYTTTALSALVAYDYIITLDQEVRCIWRRKWTFPSLVFLLNRYMTIAYAVVGLMSVFSAENCVILLKSSEVFMVALALMFSLFASLRAYAVGNRNVRFAIPILVLNSVPIGCDIFNSIKSSPAPNIYLHFCGAGNPVSAATDLQLVRASRITAIMADLLLLIQTWEATFKTTRDCRTIRFKPSYASLLLRDGTTYFLALLLMNISQLVVSELTGNQYVSPFITFLTSVLISRFSLNLKLLIEENTDAASTPSQIELPTIISRSPSMLTGNMGGSLEHIEIQQDAEDSVADQRPIVSAPWVIYDDASTSSISPNTLEDFSYP